MELSQRLGQDHALARAVGGAGPIDGSWPCPCRWAACGFSNPSCAFPNRCNLNAKKHGLILGRHHRPGYWVRGRRPIVYEAEHGPGDLPSYYVRPGSTERLASLPRTARPIASRSAAGTRSSRGIQPCSGSCGHPLHSGQDLCPEILGIFRKTKTYVPYPIQNHLRDLRPRWPRPP